MRMLNRIRMFALLVLGCPVFDNRLNRFFSGLGQALSDIKVYLFALMCFAQLLGMSFQSFFPTYVLHFVFMSVSHTHIMCLADLLQPWAITLPSAFYWQPLHGSLLRLFVASMLGTQVGSSHTPQKLRLTIRYGFILTDRTGERFFHISSWWLVVILSFIIASSTMSIAGRYVSMFLMASGFSGSSTYHLNVDVYSRI